MAGSARSLLERRLVIVTGKGGTGKTTVAAALSLAAARAGLRVLVAEMGRDEQVPRLFEARPAPVGYAGRALAPGVTGMCIDPFAALGEYLGLQLGARSVVDFALRNRSFRQLMNAAPGWRELITLGKIWHLEQMQEQPGRPLYDLVVVDAPATGHGVTFLDVPRVAVSAVRAGPLRRHAKAVEDLIEDPERCLLLPVALAEELPVRETAELVARLRDDVGIAIDRVVVNAVFPRPFPDGLDDLDERLARLPGDVHPGVPAPAVLAACARYMRARYELNRHHQIEIGRRIGLPLVVLPHLIDGVGAGEGLSTLADALLVPPRAQAA